MATEAAEAKEESNFASKLGDTSKKVWEQSKKQATFLGKEVGANATFIGKEVGVRASTLGKQVSTKVQKTDWSFCACFGGSSGADEDEAYSTAKTAQNIQNPQVPTEVNGIALDPIKSIIPEPEFAGMVEHAQQSAGHPIQLPWQQQPAASIRQPLADVVNGQQDNIGPLARGYQAKAAPPAVNSHQFSNPLMPQRGSVPSKPAVHGPTSHTPLRDAVKSMKQMQAAWVPPTDKGWQTSKLREQLASKYGVPEREVQAAFDDAVSEKIADVLCFTYALIGGPMEDAAFDEAQVHKYNKEKLLGSYGAVSTGLGGKMLTPEQRAVKERVLRDARFINSKAADEATAEDDLVDEDLEDPDQVEAEEEARLRQELDGLPAHEALQALGLPGPGLAMTDIDEVLHPMINMANRNPQQQAMRVAAYKVAVHIFNSQAEA